MFSLYCVPKRKSSPLTTRSAPIRRPVSTSHSPSHSSSFLPLACKRTSMFSRVITRDCGRTSFTAARTWSER